MTTEMIERAIDAAAAYDCTGPNCTDHDRFRAGITAAVNAAVPVVDTVSSLTAFPQDTKLLAADGKVWIKVWTSSWRSTSALTRTSEKLITMKTANPLRLIWMPK